MDRLHDIFRGTHHHLRIVAVDDDRVARFDPRQHVGRAADDRNVERACHDRHVTERRAFLEDEAAQTRAVVVEQLGRSHVARDDDHVVGLRARVGRRASGETQQQPVGQVLQIGEALADVGIGRLAHARPHVVEGALHARLGGEARVDRLAHAIAPAAIVDEHAEGF